MPNKYAILTGIGNGYENTNFDQLPYVYQDIKDLTDKLSLLNWIVYVPLLDKNANKSSILNYISEKIENLQKDDWLLFFYAGHGEKISEKTSLVTYDESLKTKAYPLPSKLFLSQIDYSNIIDKFSKQASEGHLITILDCCYAFGLIDQSGDKYNFHSILAAATEKTQAYFTDNSDFFIALSQAWDNDTIEQIGDAVVSICAQSKDNVVVQIAKEFINYSL
jgi:hypothetical protein